MKTMAKTVLEKLIASQQTELDAVLLYQALAKEMKTEEEKELLLSMAADEGKHGAILKGITGAPLKPNPALANMAVKMYKIGGRKLLFPFMAKFEINSFFSYQKYFTEYPEIAKIASDEIRHGHILNDLCNR